MHHRTFHIVTLGCKVNQYETASFITQLESHGLIQVTKKNQADLIIINTCAVTGKAGAQSRHAIRKAARENPEATVVVTGCYSQLEAEICTELEELIDRRVLLIGNDRKEELVIRCLGDDLTSQLPILSDMKEAATISPLPVKKFGNRTRAYLKIQDGCNSFCTYCIVPYTRGPSRSQPIKDVIQQAKTYEQQDHKEIVLTGIHAGNYGLDLEEKQTIVSLIDTLCREIPDIHYRLSSIEPLEVNDALLDLMVKHPNFMNHLHIPLQSGDSKILNMMGRKYTTTQFGEMIDRCHNAVPDLCIGIDVMVGFPGEDDECFENARKFLTDLPYTYLHVFPYSQRPGTPAANYQDQVPKPVKDSRVAILREISDTKKLHFYSKHLQTVRPVLIEGNRDKAGQLKGFTDNYIPVLIEGDDSLIHTVQSVCLTRQDGTLIYGEIV